MQKYTKEEGSRKQEGMSVIGGKREGRRRHIPRGSNSDFFDTPDCLLFCFRSRYKRAAPPWDSTTVGLHLSAEVF